MGSPHRLVMHTALSWHSFVFDWQVNYCKILKGGGNTKNKEERKNNSRSSICKVQEEMAAMEHAVCSKRRMSIQTKVRFGFLAQNEENADQQQVDWRLMATIKQIEANQKLIDTKMKMMDTMVDGVSKMQFFYVDHKFDG
jgi:hypothetical protein